MSRRFHIRGSLWIPEEELDVRFSRSGGPGGQNVNKVETKVDLAFNVNGSRCLSDEQKRTVLAALSSQVDERGHLHVSAQRSRSQWRNREDAIQKFVRMMQRALAPAKKRVATLRTAASRERRLRAKRIRGDTKRMRRIGRGDH